MSVGVVGLGYVGLPLVVAFAESGDQVVAVDIDERKVAAIEAGRSYIEDVASERLQAVRGSVEASTHFAPLARTDAVLICVPTPLTPNREPDLGALMAAGRRWAASCSAASWWCWSRQRIRGLRASSWCRCSSTAV